MTQASEIPLKQFMGFLAELETTFGRKYPDRQKQKFYHRVKHFPLKVWEKAIDDLETFSKALPGMGDVVEMLWKCAKALGIFPETKIDHDALAHCKRCMDSGVTLKRFRHDPIKDFYCDACNKIELHHRNTPEQLEEILKAPFQLSEVLAVKVGIKDYLQETEFEARKLFNTVLPNWPYCVIKAMLQYKDVRNNTLAQISSLVTSKHLPMFQKYLIEIAHGKDYAPELEDQTLTESFIFFCVKTDIKFGESLLCSM